MMLFVHAFFIPIGELDSLVGRNNEDDSSSFFILLSPVCDGSSPRPCRLTPDLWVDGNNLPDLGGQSLHSHINSRGTACSSQATT